MFFSKRSVFPSGSSAVEFFFVLAGFTIAMSARRSLAGRSDKEPVSMKEAAKKATGYVVSKLKAIYPVIIAVMIIYFFLLPGSINENTLNVIQNSEWEFTMMVGTPFGFNNGAAPLVPMWFLTALLVIGYLYTFALYKYNDFFMFAAPVIGILFYSFFTLNSSLVLDFYIEMGFLTAGMVKAVAEISLGVTMFGLYEVLSKKKLNKFWQIFLSLLEVFAIYRFFALTINQPLGLDNFRRIVYIMLIVLLSFLNASFLSKRFNNKFSHAIGKVSLTMYLVHFFIAQIYFPLLSFFKKFLLSLVKDPTNPQDAAMAWSKVFGKTGGYDAYFQPIGMTVLDMLLFIILVIAASLVIKLCIALIAALIRVIKKARDDRAASKNADYVIRF